MWIDERSRVWQALSVERSRLTAGNGRKSPVNAKGYRARDEPHRAVAQGKLQPAGMATAKAVLVVPVVVGIRDAGRTAGVGGHRGNGVGLYGMGPGKPQAIAGRV